MFPNMSGKKREEEFQRKMQSIMEKPRELATSARHDTDYEDPFITYNPLILTFDPNFQRWINSQLLEGISFFWCFTFQMENLQGRFV